MATVTEAWQEAIASAPADMVVLSTLELIHPTFVDDQGNPDSIRVVLDEEDHTFTLEATAPLHAGQQVLFEALALTVTQPEQEDGKLGGSLQIELDNVPRTILPSLHAAASVRARAQIIYREYVLDDTTEPDLVIDGLSAKIVQITQTKITCSATFLDLLNASFPTRIFSQEDFPGLFDGS